MGDGGGRWYLWGGVTSCLTNSFSFTFLPFEFGLDPVSKFGPKFAAKSFAGTKILRLIVEIFRLIPEILFLIEIFRLIPEKKIL